VEEILVYFRQAMANPASVPPWSEWWAANEELVGRSVSLVDYVRLKHRKLRGAQQILQRAGELPPDYAPPHPRVSGSCGSCGERVAIGSDLIGPITCTNCGLTYPDKPQPAAPSQTSS
jgi:hypothetical protein